MVRFVKPLTPQQQEDLHGQLKWIVLARVVFAIVLVFSTLFFSTQHAGGLVQPFRSIYYVAGAVLGLSLVYLFFLYRRRFLLGIAYFQTIADTALVTAIVFVTGGFESVFTFLYLVVIIYTSMVLRQQGSFVMATLSSLQYGLLIELEYFQVIAPFTGGRPLAMSVDETQIIYRIMITIAACFAVAILSGILSVQLRTARQDLKIAQEHLKRVEKMAAVDEIVSGIAHEIKNPLASLSGSIQMLREDTEEGSQADRLMQIILRETGRLKQIVNDIRLIARPSRANAQRVNVARAIEDVSTLLLNTPEWTSRIQIVSQLDTTLCTEMDPVHLQQILWNLIKNAAEAIDGAGRIEIRLSSPRNKRIYLTISDTGLGIDKAQATHIFDPFFTTKPEGTGLGLSIIHRIVDAYDGMIDFESVPGQGTLFTLIFQNADHLPV